MDIKIIETGKIESLGIIDRKSGVNWIADFMGNYGVHPEIEQDGNGWDTGHRLMTQDDFDWWSRVSDAYQGAEDRYRDLLDDIEDEDIRDRLDAKVGDINCDLEDLPAAINQICDEFEKEIETDED